MPNGTENDKIRMNENEKQKQLRKHKAIATGLFVLMAVVYFVLAYLTKYYPQNWMFYVKAFAEAGMVGALADWFAVTALFRYPFGLKIPHTNLIEKSKDAIGENLGNFVTDNFLTPSTIRPYIEKLDVMKFALNWLESSKNQQIVSEQIVGLSHYIIANLDDKTVVDAIAKKGSNLLDDLPYHIWLSDGLQYMIENAEHNRLLDILLPKAKDYVEDNRLLIYNKVVEKQPLLKLVGGKAVTNQLISGITSFLDDVKENATHPIRAEIEDKLKETAGRIKTEPSWREKIENIKNQFITYEKIRQYAEDAWLKLKEEALHNLEDKDSKIWTYITNEMSKWVDNIREDKDWQQKINGWVRQMLYKQALKNSSEVGGIITRTVADWDGKELSEKLELEVGKDLQYIRVNGTLVGGLVGVIIYTLTHFLI